jgi:ribosome maturation protein Sdo1
MEKKRKLSNRYRLANIRKKRWKDNRDHMESIRLRAISKAKFNKDIHKNMVHSLNKILKKLYRENTLKIKERCMDFHSISHT